MALNTWYNVDGTVYGGVWKSVYSGGFEWRIISQDILNNTSTIEVRMWHRKSSTSYNYFNLFDRTSYYTIDGTQYNFTSRVDMRTTENGIAANTKYYMESDTVSQAFPKCATAVVVITHNADGTRTVPITTYFNANTTSDHVTYITTTGTITLDTIPRASTLTSVNPFTVVTASNTTAVTGVALINSASFYNRFRLYQGGVLRATFDVGQQTAGNYNFSHTILDAVRTTILNAMPTSASATFTLDLITYSDSGYTTQVGSLSSKTATGTLATDYKPTVTTHSATVVNPTALFGTAVTVAVKGISYLTLALSGGTLTTGATHKAYQMRFEGTTLSGSYVSGSASGNTSLIVGSGSINAYFKIQDSRDRWSDEVPLAITVYAYTAPTNNGFDIQRDSSTVTIGNYIMNFAGSAVNNQNQLRYQRWQKLSSSGTYVAVDASYVTITVGTYTINTTLAHNLPYAEGSAYDVKIVVQDKFSTITIYDALGTAAVPFSIGSAGIGAGKIWTQGALDVAGDIYLDGIVRKAQRRATYLSVATNANDIVEEWVLSGATSGSTNFPTSPTLEWWYVQTIQYSDTRRTQVAYSYSRNEIWSRMYGLSGGSTWSSWGKVYPQDTSTPLDAYPVGSVYISVLSTSPATLFGGTWTRISSGRVLVGVNESDTRFDTAEEFGGSYNHAHTTPAHFHGLSAGFAQIQLNANCLLYLGYKTANWTANAYFTPDLGTRASATADVNTVGTSLGGTTDNNTSPANTGTSDNIMPYLVVYMWKRTA